MAVLIEGMEMPLPGTFNIIYIYSDGQVHMPSWGKGMTPTNGVKAIPIPPHGDLIDREGLQDIIGQLNLNWEYGQGVSDCWDALLDAPAIIPASEDGEG